MFTTQGNYTLHSITPKQAFVIIQAVVRRATRMNKIKIWLTILYYLDGNDELLVGSFNYQKKFWTENASLVRPKEKQKQDLFSHRKHR